MDTQNLKSRLGQLLHGKKRALLIIATALLLSAILLIARSASPLASFEAEGGILNNTVIKNDTAASDGKYAAFVGTPPPPPETFVCTRMLSMSQGRQTYEGLLGTGRAPDGSWEAEITGGAGLQKWVDRNFEGYSGTMIGHCSGASEPDRIVFLYDPLLSVWPDDMHTVLGNIRFHHPQAKQIVLILLVGGQNNATCSSPTEPGKSVRASTTHAAFDGTVGPVANQYGDVEAGPDLEVPCNQYADSVGHLTATGIQNVGVQVADWFGY